MSSTSSLEKSKRTISDLPAEIRAEIIHCAMDEEPCDVLKFMHLCRCFRRLPLVYATLWVRGLIAFDNYDIITFFLRAANDFDRALPLDDILRSRFISKDTQMRIAGEIRHYLPGLRRATKIISCRTSDPFINWSPILPLIGVFTNLTCLSVCIIVTNHFDSSLPPFSAPLLTDLSIVCGNSTVHRVLAPTGKEFLSRFPKLFRLSLTHLGVYERKKDDERVPLPNLKHLEVHDLTDHDLRCLRDLIAIESEPLSLVLRLRSGFDASLQRLWPDAHIKDASRLRLTLKPCILGMQLILEDADAQAMRADQLDWAQDFGCALGPHFVMKEYRHNSIDADVPLHMLGEVVTGDIYPRMLEEAALYASRVAIVVISAFELGNQERAIISSWEARCRNIVQLLRLLQPSCFIIPSEHSLWSLVTCVPEFLWPKLRHLQVTCLPVDGKSTGYDQLMINEVAKWLDSPSHLGAVAVTLFSDTHTEWRPASSPGGNFVLKLSGLRLRCSELLDCRMS